MKVLKGLAFSTALLFTISATAYAGTTFDSVQKKGFVQCGVSTGIPGFSGVASKGEWKGLDIDLCRAIAATMFGDASKFKAMPLSTQQRFLALQSGLVDVLTRNTTTTLMRDTSLGIIGAGVNYYDSQGIMVKKTPNIKSAKDLNGATICVQAGTTTELNLADWFREQNLSYQPVVLDRLEDALNAFLSGRCDAFTSDKSQLAAVRTAFESPKKYVILAENFSKEPLGPVVRQGDEQWFNVVRWTLNALLEAEEYGLTRSNVDEMLNSTNPNIQRILGVTPGMGKNLGVDNKWAYNIIKQVGNYGESFDNALGKNSPLKLERGLNASYTKGGLMYGWPIR